MTLRVASEALVTVAQVRAADNCGCVTPTVPSDAELQEIIDAVSDEIAVVTGSISGRQDVVARPCRTVAWCACSCCDLDVIPLGDKRPTVTAVKIDGVTLGTDAYWVHWSGFQWVIARRPTGTETHPPAWPSWQKRWLPDTSIDTFSIAMTTGIHTDSVTIRDAALEAVCDRVAASSKVDRVLDGITQITVGGTTATVDDDRLARIAAGAVGPAMQHLMAIVAPGGRAHSTVWAPELSLGWDMNFELA